MNILKREAALPFIFITMLIDITGFTIIIPVMPKLISELIHGSISDAARYGGWLVFSFAIMQFLFSPVMGNLSDRYGRRPVILLALFGLGIDYLVLAMAPTIGWLFAGRLFAGIFGASFTTASAYIADITPPEKRAQNFGMIGVAFGLGFIIGPLLGGILGAYGSRIPFFASAGLALANCLYGYFILPESLPKEHRRKFELKNANPVGALLRVKRYPVVAGLLIAVFFIYLAAHAVQSTWTYFTMERFQWNETMVGLSLSVVGVLIAIVQGGLIRLIIPKFGQKRSVYIGLTMYSIGFLLFGMATQSWMMFAFLVPYCLGGITSPALQGIMSTQVPRNEQGELQGAITSTMSLTAVIGPLLMTNLFAFFTGSQAPFYYPGIPFIAGMLLTLISLAFAYKTLSFHFGKHSPKPDPAKREEELITMAD